MTQSARPSQNRYAIDSVTRAITLLKAVAERPALSLEEACALTGVSKSTAFRLLETLQDGGLVERSATGGYRAGVEAVRWSLLLLGRLDVPAQAATDLRQLWLETKESVVLGLLTGTRLVLADILESPAPFRMAEVPGVIVPMHASALGKAIGAYLDERDLRECVGEEPYEAVTDNCATTFLDLSERLAVVRDTGYATEIEEGALGVACVAAPLYKAGEVTGAISIAGPRVRMTDERLAALGPRVREVADLISSRLSPGTAAPPPTRRP